MEEENKKFTVLDPFKSADLFRRTNIKPQIKYDAFSGKVSFIFPYLKEVLNALDAHQRNVDGIKEFILIFKSLRNEMMQVLNENRKGANDKPR